MDFFTNLKFSISEPGLNRFVLCLLHMSLSKNISAKNFYPQKQRTNCVSVLNKVYYFASSENLCSLMIFVKSAVGRMLKNSINVNISPNLILDVFCLSCLHHHHFCLILGSVNSRMTEIPFVAIAPSTPFNAIYWNICFGMRGSMTVCDTLFDGLQLYRYQNDRIKTAQI